MFAVGLVGFALSVLLAVAANSRFADLERLPMQWGLSGQVNWTAPRVLGLAFVPVLYAVLAGIFIWAAEHDPEKYTAKSVGIVLIALIAVQILHLWMIDRYRLKLLK
ncbi:hypothetical protein [Brucella intermedia]|uniref:hypothetical protein n=1 Tax=Brucella intermedia TaxID=94625 RepID=UPI00124BD753|nr:hypothetical protein [Brucella intermedia]KAB2718282.1 hypothetical protein F9K75_07060 [Brucella intermedia]